MSEVIARVKLNESNVKKLLASSSELESFLSALFFSSPIEITYIVLFDKKDRFISSECIGKGDAIGSPVNLRKFLSLAKEKNAASVVLAHNHVNGMPMPSERDEEITRTVHMALDANNITLIEHYVVSNDRCYPIINT